MLSCRNTVCLLAASLFVSGQHSVANAGRKPVIPAQKPVPQLKSIDLFAGLESKQIDAELVQKDESVGNLFVENKTEKPLNVKMPEAFVGVHVLNQGFFGPQSGSNTVLGQNQQGSGQGGQVTGGGNSSNAFPGLSSGQSQGPIFSIPPEKIVRIPVKTVCLEHGRPTPSSRMDYRIFPVEKFSNSPALQELLAEVAKGRTPQNVAQAAAWRLSNDMSWKDLANLKFSRLGSLPDVPHFTQRELRDARNLVARSEKLAKKRPELRPEKAELTARPVVAQVKSR